MWYIYIIVGIIILICGILFLIYKNQKEEKVKYDTEELDKFREDRAQIIKAKTVAVQPKEIPKVIFKDSITPTPTISTDTFWLPEYETSINYDDLLKSPRWLDKRNIILERDHHKCCYCGSIYKLQVHHKYYSKYPNGKKVDPWNYSNDALITLCDKCHKKVHQRKTIKVYYRKYDFSC